MKLSIKAGSTSQSINIWVQDSSSATGAGLTGLAYNTASLVAYYALPKTVATAITLVTLAAVTTAYASGGFKEIDATNMPGWYRLDLPNAVIASGSFVSLHLKGATNMAPLPIEIALVAFDPQDGVRLGLTTLPNVAAAASGGLPTVDAYNSVKIQAGLKKNQALSNFAFYMTDSTAHNPATGKTVTVTRRIDSGSHSAGTLSSITEVGNGEYRVDFLAADMNGGVIVIRATASGCDDTEIQLITTP